MRHGASWVIESSCRFGAPKNLTRYFCHFGTIFFVNCAINRFFATHRLFCIEKNTVLIWFVEFAQCVFTVARCDVGTAIERMHAAMGEILPLAWNTDFAAVVREHAPTMRARLRKAGLLPADVDDCIQDAFVLAWLLHHQMPRDHKERRQWLGRLAFNASRRRRRELKRTHYVESSRLAELAGESRSNTEAAAMLVEMLDRLPERYHEIVGLRARGYSIDDIAKHYGIPWNTAKSRWNRACVAMDACNCLQNEKEHER